MSTSSGSRVRRLGTIAMSSNPYARRPDLPMPISTSPRCSPFALQPGERRKSSPAHDPQRGRRRSLNPVRTSMRPAADVRRGLLPFAAFRTRSTVGRVVPASEARSSSQRDHDRSIAVLERVGQLDQAAQGADISCDVERVEQVGGQAADLGPQDLDQEPVDARRVLAEVLEPLPAEAPALGARCMATAARRASAVSSACSPNTSPGPSTVRVTTSPSGVSLRMATWPRSRRCSVSPRIALVEDHLALGEAATAELGEQLGPHVLGQPVEQRTPRGHRRTLAGASRTSVVADTQRASPAAPTDRPNERTMTSTRRTRASHPGAPTDGLGGPAMEAAHPTDDSTVSSTSSSTRSSTSPAPTTA